LQWISTCGLRQVRIRAQRTRVNWAAWARELVDVHDPKAEQIVLAMDILTIHSPPSLYVAFPRRGQADRRPAGDPSHVHAQHLAEHGGDRTERAAATVERGVAVWA
jgi:hypothetical protein